ncbi:MAG: E3 binding domain-containing protein [Deinococcales bacterium]
MAKDVIMPVLGMNQDTAVLLAWLKQEGDAVEAGEPIMEVETDKATMELDAPASGTLAGVRAAAGDEVKVGSVIAVILTEGESVADARPAGDAHADADGPPAPNRDGPAAAPAGASHPAAPRSAPEAAAQTPTTETPAAAPLRVAVADEPAITSAQATGIVPASPKARRLAAENSVSLEALRARGSGPDGAVLAADVLRAAHHTGAAARALAGAPGAVAALRFERVLDAGPLLATVSWARERLSDAEAGLDVGDLLARFLMAVWSHQPLTAAAAPAAVRYRRIADGTAGDVALGAAEAASLPAIVHARVAAAGVAGEHPGTAAAAEELALLDLSRARADLTSDSVGATGALVEAVVGRLEERVLAVDGEPVVAASLRLTFAFDPARVDVAEAARFCDRVVALAEEPAALALLY